MKKYKCLKNNLLFVGEYSIIPIRDFDKENIRKWRNDQIYHLRQNEILTKSDQSIYFKDVISKLFDQKKPNQILFSFLKNNNLIGYGGLVHIDWDSKNAEISFLIDTKLEKNNFNDFWKNFLKMIENVAFDDLRFNKLYVYAYNLRPNLFDALNDNNYFKEATLKSHVYYNKTFIDVLIYSKFK